jgi:hypothetical protein
LHRGNIFSSLFYYVTISSHMHIRRNLKLTWNFSQSESIIGCHGPRLIFHNCVDISSCSRIMMMFVYMYQILTPYCHSFMSSVARVCWLCGANQPASASCMEMVVLIERKRQFAVQHIINNNLVQVVSLFVIKCI